MRLIRKCDTISAFIFWLNVRHINESVILTVQLCFWLNVRQIREIVILTVH